MAVRLTSGGKLFIVILIAALAFCGFYFLGGKNVLAKLAPKGKQMGTGEVAKGIFSGKDKDDVIKVGVVTWGGYAGGEYFNEAFTASEKSRFFKEYGIKVSFKVIDDFIASRRAFETDEVNVLWITADAFPTESGALKEYAPKIIFQADWSRGGDAIVVRPGINTANDLLGKKIAVAFGTPSHSFLFYTLDAGNLNYSDVEVVQVANAIDAATTFKAGKVDAAVVWSPDDDDCVNTVKGSKVLLSSKKAGYIIADVFYAKAEYIEKNRKNLKKLIRGWLVGAAEINGSDEAHQKAASILNSGFTGVDSGFCYNAIGKARLCTYGDNLKFFGINNELGDMTGKKLYEKMTKIYRMVNMANAQTPSWEEVIDITLLQELQAMSTMPGQEPEGKVIYTKETKTNAKAISTKSVTITFPTGSFRLDGNAQQIIDLKFADLALMSTNKIKIEGNTDNVGSAQVNISLSKKRAESVADYLSTKHGISRNRFIVSGNGSDKPVADNNTDEGREKNRRTDFMLLEN